MMVLGGPPLPIHPISRHESESSINDSSVPQAPHPPLNRSASIPIGGNSLKRTLSEEQLCDDNRMAEFRDEVMFRRLVDGISAKQLGTVGYRSRRINEMCIASIVGARAKSEEELRKATTKDGNNNTRTRSCDSIPYTCWNNATGNPTSLYGMMMIPATTAPRGGSLGTVLVEVDQDNQEEDPMFDLEL